MEERSAKMKRKEELKNVLWNWEGKEIRWRINLKMIKYELIKAAFFLFNSMYIHFSHSQPAAGSSTRRRIPWTRASFIVAPRSGKRTGQCCRRSRRKLICWNWVEHSLRDLRRRRKR